MSKLLRINLNLNFLASKNNLDIHRIKTLQGFVLVFIIIYDLGLKVFS